LQRLLILELPPVSVCGPDGGGKEMRISEEKEYKQQSKVRRQHPSDLSRQSAPEVGSNRRVGGHLRVKMKLQRWRSEGPRSHAGVNGELQLRAFLPALRCKELRGIQQQAPAARSFVFLILTQHDPRLGMRSLGQQAP
jgi:hypothetical protein